MKEGWKLRDRTSEEGVCVRLCCLVVSVYVCYLVVLVSVEMYSCIRADRRGFRLVD